MSSLKPNACLAEATAKAGLRLAATRPHLLVNPLYQISTHMSIKLFKINL